MLLFVFRPKPWAEEEEEEEPIPGKTSFLPPLLMSGYLNLKSRRITDKD